MPRLPPQLTATALCTRPAPIRCNRLLLAIVTGRTARDPVRLRRAIVVLMSAQGQAAPDIAHLLVCSPEYVRGVIHAFNESGFAALDPKWSGGRPKTISEHARRQVCLIARCCPRDLGLAFSTWSLAKLADYLAAAGIARISRESARQILQAGGVRRPPRPGRLPPARTSSPRCAGC